MTPEERKTHLAELLALRAQADAFGALVDSYIMRYGPEEVEAAGLTLLEEPQHAACPHRNREDISGFGALRRYHCSDCGHEWTEGEGAAHG